MNAVQNVSKRRDDRAGRRCTIGNRVYAKSVSGVRIPISPPELSRRNLYGNAFFIQSALKTGRLHPMRRGGRVVECGGLENRFTGNPVTRVRIPPPPPRDFRFLQLQGPFLFPGVLLRIRTERRGSLWFELAFRARRASCGVSKDVVLICESAMLSG